MSRGITDAIFAEPGEIFSSILFITTVRSGVKNAAAIFISFSGIVSITAALFVSRQLIRFFNFWWSNKRKEKCFFSKKVLFIKFLFYLFYVWVGFVSIQNITEYFLFAFALWHFWKIFGVFSTTYLHNIDVVFIKCASKCFFCQLWQRYSPQGLYRTRNGTFVCRKRLNEFPKTYIVVYSFFRKAH